MEDEADMIEQALISPVLMRTVTPSGLARKAGLHTTTVSRFLAGKTKHPKLDIAAAMAQALGTSLADILRPVGRARVAPCGHKQAIPGGVLLNDFTVGCRDCGARWEWVLVGAEA
jgi:transcriptional regulator with XRE-family HTH domain